MISNCLVRFSMILKNKAPHLFIVMKNNQLLRGCYNRLQSHIALGEKNIYLGKRRKAVKKYGYFILDEIFKLSKSIGITIWIDGGTLLGYEREKQLLEYDYDVDFATYQLQNKDRIKLIKALRQRRIELVRSYMLNDEHIQDGFFYKGLIFDIVYYFGNENYSYYYDADVSERSIMKKQGGTLYVKGMDLYKFPTRNMTYIESTFSNGCPCFVPSDHLRRTEELYGKDWRTPIINEYDWTRDCQYEFEGFNKCIKYWKSK